jgi:hypothetical protein
MDCVGVKGTLSPVVPLETFVELHRKILFEECAQTIVGPTQDSGGDHGVKEVGERKAKVPLQTEDIILGSMEHLLDGRIGEDRSEDSGINGERVNQIISAGDRKLDQANFLEIAIEAITFGVYGNNRLGG